MADQGHLDVPRAAPGPFKIKQRYDTPVLDQDVSRGAVAVQHHVRVPADRDPRGDLGQTRGDRVQDVLVSERCGVGVLAAMATGSVSVSGHSAAAYRASSGAGGCHECRLRMISASCDTYER